MKQTFITGGYRAIAKLMTQHLSIGLMFCCFNAYSQSDFSDSAYKETLSKSYPVQNELFLAELKSRTTEKKLLKHYESRYKDVFKTVNEKIKEGQMVYNPAMFAVLEKIISEIKTKNKIVPNDVRVLLLRENQPNAYTLCDNTIFVNMGLFYHLETEDQVAGVLAHEIGHLLLTHSLIAMNYSYETDKQSAQNIKEIKEVEIKRADRAFDLMKNSIYKGGIIRRYHEMQADSMGYVLFRNTKYQQTAFIDVLELIEPLDTMVQGYLATETLKRFFDLPLQKFEDNWLKAEDFSSYNYTAYTAKLNKDSLSSHPKGKERTQYLKTIFPELSVQQGNAKSVVSTTAFNDVKAIAEKERIPNLYFNERYGEAVYLALLCLQKEPDNAYYKNWLRKGLKKIHRARRDYQLNKYLDRVNPKEQSESYMRFLNFMWNLNLNELKNIADYYSVKE